LQQQLKFIFHESSPLKKMIAVIHFVYYFFKNIIASCNCTSFNWFCSSPWCLASQPPSIKQYTVTLWVYTNLIPGRGKGEWTLGLIFFLRSREFGLLLYWHGLFWEIVTKINLLLISKEDTFILGYTWQNCCRNYAILCSH